MGFIADINGLSPKIKNFLLSMSCLMPFWYLCIYIFNPFLFSHSKIDLLGPLTFCLSLLWYLVSLVVNIVFGLVFNHVTGDDDDPPEDLIILGGLDAIIYLGVAVLIAYWSKTKYDAVGIHYRFIFFLKIAFWFAILRAAFIFVMSYFIYKANERGRSNNSSTQ